VNAQYDLGAAYYKGRGVDTNYAEALKWFRKAADQGNANAEYVVGGVYLNGQGVPQDYAKALKWLRKATDQGYAEAQYNLGQMYANGWGVEKDFAEAAKWYRKAAEQGDSDAQAKLTDLSKRLPALHTSNSKAPSSKAPFEGLWAQTKEECLDEDGPNSRTYIDLNNLEDGKPTPLLDQYENHCVIENRVSTGGEIHLDVTCFEFWEYFNKRTNGVKAMIKLSPKSDGRLMIDGRQYQRCEAREVAARDDLRNAASVPASQPLFLGSPAPREQMPRALSGRPSLALIDRRALSVRG
jgi:hypothetical protein